MKVLKMVSTVSEAKSLAFRAVAHQKKDLSPKIREDRAFLSFSFSPAFLEVDASFVIARKLTNRPNKRNIMPKGSGTNSQGNHYSTPGGTNSNSGGSYHCKYLAFE